MTGKETHISKDDVWRSTASVLAMMSSQTLYMPIAVGGVLFLAICIGASAGIVENIRGWADGLWAAAFLLFVLHVVLFFINQQHFYRLLANTVPDGKIEYTFDQEQCTVVSGGSTRSYPWSDSIALIKALGIICIELDGDYGARRFPGVFLQGEGTKSVPPELSFPVVWFMPRPIRKFLIIPLRCVDQSVLSVIRAAVSHNKAVSLPAR